MAYVLILLLGAAAGAICTFVVLDSRRRGLDAEALRQQEQQERVKEAIEELAGKRQGLEKQQQLV